MKEQTLVIVIFGYSDAPYSLSLIAGGLTKGFEDGSQAISVKTGTLVAVAVRGRVLVRVDINVEATSSCLGVDEVTELQPARNRMIVSNEI